MREAAEVAQALRDPGRITPSGSTCWPTSSRRYPIEPGDGWFRTAVAQTRFDWASTRKRFDRDGDGRIKREEITGADADFARLDRNHDKVVDRGRFRLLLARTGSLAGCHGVLARRPRRQRQGHARGARRVLPGIRQRRRGLPVALRPARGVRPLPASRPAELRPASKATLVRSLFRQELGSLQPGPKLDESAPDFTLRTATARRRSRFRSSSARSRSCWSSATSRAVRSEARPATSRNSTAATRTARRSSWSTSARPIRPMAGGWRATSGSASRPAPARSYEERVGVAQKCSRVLGLGMPMLVDTIDDTVGAATAGCRAGST